MTSTVVVHSNIVDGGRWQDRKGQRSIMLWYWCRWLDTTGRGKTYLNFEQCARHFGESIRTVKRWLYDGVHHRLFHGYQLAPGGAWVRLSSRDRVALHLGLTDFGEIFNLNIEDLPYAKSEATAATASSLTKQSMFNTRKHSKTSEVLSFEQMISPSENAPGVLWRSPRYCFLASNVPMIGATQSTMSILMVRSDRTIRRRLSNSERLRYPLKTIPQIQLAQHAPQLDILLKGRIDPRDFHDRAFVVPSVGKVFIAGPKIYQPDIDRRPQRYARSKYKRKLSKVFAGAPGVQPGAAISSGYEILKSFSPRGAEI